MLCQLQMVALLYYIVIAAGTAALAAARFSAAERPPDAKGVLLGSTGGERGLVVAMIPSIMDTVEIESPGAGEVKWAKVSHGERSSACPSLDILGPSENAALGPWAEIRMGRKLPDKTCRAWDADLVCLTLRNATNAAPYKRKNADTLRILTRRRGGVLPARRRRNRSQLRRRVLPGALEPSVSSADNGIGELAVRELDVVATVRAALREDGVRGWRTALPSHTLTLFGRRARGSGAAQRAALLCVVYFSPELSAHVDALVAVSLRDGSLVRTATGRASLVFARDLGTTAEEDYNTRFKLPYVAPKAGIEAVDEQWHLNGVLSFEDALGTALLAVTFKALAEVVVLTDPYFVAAPPEIVQRFGTPPSSAANSRRHSRRHFGCFGLRDKGVYFGMVHNVYYTRYAGDNRFGTSMPRETLTCLVNYLVGDDSDGASSACSVAFEFDLKLVHARDLGERTSADDRVFDTSYRAAELLFRADLQGGARPVADGVYVATTGLSFEGIGIDRPSPGGACRAEWAQEHGGRLPNGVQLVGASRTCDTGTKQCTALQSPCPEYFADYASHAPSRFHDLYGPDVVLGYAVE